MLLDLTHPGLHSGEALSVGNVVGHNNTVSSLVVTGSNSLESFLTSGVPDLKLDGLAININGSDFEVNSNCGHKVLCEDVILNIKDSNLD